MAADRLRVWVIINEITDGNWGGAGQIFRLADILAFARADEQEIARRTARLSQPTERPDDRERCSTGPGASRGLGLVRHRIGQCRRMASMRPERLSAPWPPAIR